MYILIATGNNKDKFDVRMIPAILQHLKCSKRIKAQGAAAQKTAVTVFIGFINRICDQQRDSMQH